MQLCLLLLTNCSKLPHTDEPQSYHSCLLPIELGDPSAGVYFHSFLRVSRYNYFIPVSVANAGCRFILPELESFLPSMTRRSPLGVQFLSLQRRPVNLYRDLLLTPSCDLANFAVIRFKCHFILGLINMSAAEIPPGVPGFGVGQNTNKIHRSVFPLFPYLAT